VLNCRQPHLDLFRQKPEGLFIRGECVLQAT